ncbi:Uncharacterised protein [uncultured archaeon]|nr:Uncharacterised protein [uncultured archaeon]
MTLDPDVRQYLDDFRQAVEHRFALYEKELSQYRRQLPSVALAEHASETAETAYIGVGELRAMFANEQKAVRELFQNEFVELRKQQRNTIAAQNNRTRLWVAAFGAMALIITGAYGLIDRWASANAREQMRTVCGQEIEKRDIGHDERDRRIIDEAVRTTLQQRELQGDVIWGSHQR